MTSTGATARPLVFERRDRIAAELQQAAVDGWLVYDFRGSNPTFGHLLGDAVAKSTRRAFLFVNLEAQPHLLIHHVDAGNFGRLGIGVQPYGGRDEMLDGLRVLLHGSRRVLMEYSPGNAIPYVSRVDGGTLELVRSLGVDVLSSADVLASVVAAWDSADVASHERAATALDEAREALFNALRQALKRGESWSEVDAQRHLVQEMHGRGLEFDHPPIVAVNEHAGDPHYAPVPELALPIQRGDLVLVDLWGRESHRADGHLGAYADITWMATAAERVTDEQRRVWEVVRDARDAAVRLLEERTATGQPVQGGEVDRASRRVIHDAGFGSAFTHRTGHSIGWLLAHGDGVNIDDFETHDTRLLRPGAAFSIEPGVYLPSFGVRSEIDALIDVDGRFRVTTRVQRELVPLV